MIVILDYEETDIATSFNFAVDDNVNYIFRDNFYLSQEICYIIDL